MPTYKVTVVGEVDADGPDEALDLAENGQWHAMQVTVDTEPTR
jgi:hypothetical protein